MAEHLNEQQLKGYRDRALGLGELVAVDMHLGSCQTCRTALAALANQGSTAAVVSGIDQARFHHLSYEQMDDWVEDRLDSADRELVMAHIGLCPACARQLIAYQEYAPAMAEPVRVAPIAATQPVAVKRSWWAIFKEPQYALGAAALISFFIITPLMKHSGEPPQPTGAIVAPANTGGESTVPSQPSQLFNEALSATELDALPDSVRTGAKEAIEGSGRPASLRGLEPNSDATIEYPRSEVIEETQPVLKWQAFALPGDSYDISLSDARGLLSRRAGISETQWTPSSPLLRDHIYTVEVASGGVKHRATFKVLSSKQEQDLQSIRAAHGTSHLVMGAVSEDLGLLTAAQQQFEAMAKEGGKTQQAAKLLERVEALRK